MEGEKNAADLEIAPEEAVCALCCNRNNAISPVTFYVMCWESVSASVFN